MVTFMMASSADVYSARMRMLTIAALTLAVAAADVAAQKTILVKDLPPAVQRVVQDEQSKGATIKKVSAEKEQGKTVYEVETTVAGHTRDVIVDATGRIVESEEEISICDVSTIDV
jgi:hypothetical protein